MALIQCPDCGTQVSDQAAACPKCAHPFRAAPPLIVQTAAPKKKGWGCGGVILVFGFFVVIIIAGLSRESEKNFNTPIVSNPETPLEEAQKQVTIQGWSWYKDADVLMKANFIITNGSRFDIKDIKIECQHSGPSGTKIDSNTRTIYEIIRAGQVLRIHDFDMGFIHSQAVHSTARIVDFVIVPQ